MKKNELFKQIPKVDLLLKNEQFQTENKDLLLIAVHHVLDSIRKDILDEKIVTLLDEKNILDSISQKINSLNVRNLRRVVNATGVVLHTNLGRACLSKEAAQAAMDVGMHYSTLEYDVQRGGRGTRYCAVEGLLTELTGAQSALVVNNNAAAVLLVLGEMAKGKEVVISRGELVEIGGSFRVPEVMEQSGAILKEVGTTNKTHLRDYEQAISDNTGALLRVHTSNYKIVGFTHQVPLEELVCLGKERNIPVIEDLGSGAMDSLGEIGLLEEPSIRESIATSADIVTVSGDKLLGSSQAGIILGKKEYIDRIKKNPLLRALRIDKMSLASLEVTLRQYREASTSKETIPVLKMLSTSNEVLQKKAEQLAKLLECQRLRIEIVETKNEVGGGSAPTALLNSYAVSIQSEHISTAKIERFMRLSAIPIIGRVYDDRFLLDVRTISEGEFDIIQAQLAGIWGGNIE